MLNRMDSDSSTSICAINTSHDVRNHMTKKGRTRKKQKRLNKRCFGDSPSKVDILIAKETSPSSSSYLCLLAKGNIEVRGEPSNNSQVSKCDDDVMYKSLMDHIRSLDIMLDKDSDKIKELSKTNGSLTTKLDKLNESHEELAKKYALLVESNNKLLARHNKLVIEHKELTSSYKELENSKFDHLPSNTPSSNDDKPSVAKVMHLPHAMIFLICLAPLLALIFLLHLAHPFAMSFLLLRVTLQGKIMRSSKKWKSSRRTWWT